MQSFSLLFYELGDIAQMSDTINSRWFRVATNGFHIQQRGRKKLETNNCMIQNKQKKNCKIISIKYIFSWILRVEATKKKV